METSGRILGPEHTTYKYNKNKKHQAQTAQGCVQAGTFPPSQPLRDALKDSKDFQTTRYRKRKSLTMSIIAHVNEASWCFLNV